MGTQLGHPSWFEANRMTSNRDQKRPSDTALALDGGVCVVGSGRRFLSGISYYTHRLVGALAERGRGRVAAILMRELLPRRLYPGAERIGSNLAELAYPPEVRTFDGVDWWWGRSMLEAIRLLRSERPSFVVMQWWTGTVLHSYLALALVARLLGARVVIEFHEVQDTGELAIAPARWYVSAVSPALIALCQGFVVHNEFDRAELAKRYRIGGKPIALIPHGPYDQYADAAGGTGDEAAPAGSGADAVTRLLYFGVIRPFKGVEDLLEAFESLTAEEAAGFQLTIVGETWEGWTRPAEMIAASRHFERIEFVNRYVADDEVAGFFAAADAVVLPYHRSSSSGPLHIAMSHGLPVVLSQVGGLIEASADYEGALPIPPRDPAAIRAAIDRAAELRGRRFEDVHSWERTVDGYEQLFEQLAA